MISRAFVTEAGPSAAMSDEDLAALAGVEARAITSARAGVPDWRLKAQIDAVAAAMGADPQQLKAQIAAAERRIWSRGGVGFPNQMEAHGAYAGLMNRS